MNVFCFCNHITPSLQDRESVCRLLEHDIRPFKPLKLSFDENGPHFYDL